VLLVLEVIGTLLLAFGVFLWASGGSVIPMAPAQARGLGIALGVLGLLLTVPFAVAIVRRAARLQREQRRSGSR
jgi:multisubunit Na+/H+ antiporter MnhG subunit